MTAFLKVFLVIGIAYFLAGIYYGSTIAVLFLSKKYGLQKWEPVAKLSIATLLTYTISSGIRHHPYTFRNLDDVSLYIVALATVLITVLIVLQIPRVYMGPNKICSSALDGMVMEIAQRLMMQPFVYWLLYHFHIPCPTQCTVLITAIVWCLGILTQQLICKYDLNRAFAVEMLASFVFSIGVGYIFQKSGFILLTMLAHALERILSSVLNNRKYHTKK